MNINRFKVETQLVSWIQKYDTEMIDKQVELDEYLDKYEEELSKCKELEVIKYDFNNSSRFISSQKELINEIIIFNHILGENSRTRHRIYSANGRTRRGVSSRNGGEDEQVHAGTRC